jgi:hypothetical protein
VTQDLDTFLKAGSQTVVGLKKSFRHRKSALSTNFDCFRLRISTAGSFSL